jgi:HEAT repeat protein
MRTMAWFLLAAMLATNTIGLAYADQLRPLIDDLKSADTTTVLKAIRGLGESGDIRAVPPLLEALRDKRGVVRQYTVEALQHLVQALDDGYLVVKRWLQSLINKLRLDPAEDMITVEQSVVYPLGKAALSVNVGSKTCA